MLFRSSLPWCFPIREVPFEQKESQEKQQQQEEKVAKIIFSVGFRSYIREFSGAILMLFRPSVPWCFFPFREVPFEQKQSQEQEQQQQQQQQEEKVAKIMLFCGFQKLHWGVFGRNFDAFSSFTAMVFSHPGGAF